MASRKRLQQLQKLQSALADHVKTRSSAASAAAAAAEAPAPPSASTPAAAPEVPPEEAAPKTPPTKRARKKKNEVPAVPAEPPAKPPSAAPPVPNSVPDSVPDPIPEDENSAPKGPPAKRARTKKPDDSNAEPARKQSRAKKDQHKPPDFEISWSNHSRVMEHFGLTEDEATATLAGLLGPDRGGEEFWNRFRARNHASFHDEPAAAPSNDSAAPAAGSLSAAAAPSVKPAPQRKVEPMVEPKAEPAASATPAAPAPRLLTRAERELIEDSQLPESDEECDDATCDYVAFDDGNDDDEEDELDVVSSGGRPPHAPSPGVSTPSVAPTASEGSVVDQLETQPVGETEPVIQHVPCSDDPGRIAREELAAKLKCQPTPARSEKVG